MNLRKKTYMSGDANQDIGNNAFHKLLRLLNDYFPKNSAQYARIKDRFSEDLNDYLSLLNEIEKRLNRKRRIGVSKEERLRRMSNRIIFTGNELEKEIDSIVVKKRIRELFRQCIYKWACKSHIIKRSLDKPRGYSGDYKTIEMFYDQKTISRGIGYYFDKYILTNKLAKADISRKDKMKELIKSFIERTSLKEIKVVNFGCGGSKELRDLFQNYIPDKEINIMLVDQDVEALKFSKKYLSILPSTVSVKYVHKNILELIRTYRNKINQMPFLNKNLVYSMGLVDYFGDNTLQLFVRFCLKMLAPGGQLIIAHKNADKWKSFLAPSWVCDWQFYQRNKDEVIKIISDEIAGCSLKIRWEKTHHMFFLILTKKT